MRIIKFSVIFILSSMGVSVAGDLALKRTEKNSGVDFYKEEITLAVNDSEAAVHGIYYFRNNTDKSGDFPVLFPFFVDSLSQFPNYIRPYIIDSAKTVNLSFRTIEKASSISLAIPIKAKSVTIWYLDYAQRIRMTCARYIITSTNAWGMPLQEGTYRFIAPIDYDSIRTWPTADSSYKDGEKAIFLSHKMDFLPQQDMEIYWIKK
jgi:hypothetical protein